MSIGKIVKIEFFVYLNKKLYRIVHSWEELEATEKEIFTDHPDLDSNLPIDEVSEMLDGIQKELEE